MRLRDHDDDPDATVSEDERRAAAALRRALGTDSSKSASTSATAAAQDSGPSAQRIVGSEGPTDAASAAGHASSASPLPLAQSNEARFLIAHLRYPKAEDSLGEVKARRLARMAQEAVHLRRIRHTQRASSWARLGRSLSSTAGLLGAAGLLLLVSWLILDQGDPRRPSRKDGGSLRVSRVSPPSARVTSTLLLRQSLAKREDPAARLDLMIQRRMNELRGSALDPVPGGRGLALAGWPSVVERGVP